MSWGTVAIILVIVGVWIWLLSNIDFEEELEELQRELEEQHKAQGN